MAKKCVTCKQKFKPQFNSLQRTCSIPCALADGIDQRQKKEKKDHQAAKLKVKPKGYHVKLAQKAFNRCKRAMDYLRPCISCNRYDHEITEHYTGGKWDCGHFKTVGAYPELRFVLYNAHKQCKGCNSGSYHHAKKTRTVAESYRINLIEKIGLDNVEWLEVTHGAKNYSIDDLIEIKQGFNAWATELEKEIANAA